MQRTKQQSYKSKKNVPQGQDVGKKTVNTNKNKSLWGRNLAKKENKKGKIKAAEFIVFCNRKE